MEQSSDLEEIAYANLLCYWFSREQGKPNKDFLYKSIEFYSKYLESNTELDPVHIITLTRRFVDLLRQAKKFNEALQIIDEVLSVVNTYNNPDSEKTIAKIIKFFTLEKELVLKNDDSPHSYDLEGCH